MRRKSREAKQLQNSYRPDRHKEPLQFPDATGISLRPPAYLKKNKLALGEWKRVAPYLEAEGILKEPDISLLASYCILYSRFREAAADVEARGQIITVTSTTRTGKTEKPIANPSCRTEILYQAAMLKAAVKYGLPPIDRQRLPAAPDDEDDRDLLQRFLDDDDFGVTDSSTSSNTPLPI